MKRLDDYRDEIIKFCVYLFFPGFFVCAIASLFTNWLLLFMVERLKIIAINTDTINIIVPVVGILAVLIFTYRLVEKPINQNLLIEKQTIEHIESQHLYNGVPFGSINGDWEKFKSHYQEGDEIWLWRTFPITWKMLTGREGYVIVRNRKTTKYSILTGMN